jgi:hypothetical protein
MFRPKAVLPGFDPLERPRIDAEALGELFLRPTARAT